MILDEYVDRIASDQEGFDLFTGQWSTAVPGVVTSGKVPLFDDPRISDFVTEIGGLAGKKVIELGPLEGGHSAMLERLGAESVTAIEANQRAFVKCLVVQNHFGLRKTKFLLGDFHKFLLSAPSNSFDVSVACGVLYHMQDPVSILENLFRITQNSVYLWSHFYDPEAISKRPEIQGKFRGTSDLLFQNIAVTGHRYYYGDALNWNGFCGGPREYANWIGLENIVDIAKKSGWIVSDSLHVTSDHPNGPCVSACFTRA
jgi:SAM-dependent methyltransferase